MRPLPDKKISAASQTVARPTARIAPQIRLDGHRQPPTMCSQCSRFHTNRFTFGGVNYSPTREHRFCPVEYFHNSPEAMLRFTVTACRNLRIECLPSVHVHGMARK